MKDKMWFTHHAKSSAAVVSIGVHALLLVLALSFVAVTVIQKEEKKFEAKQVTRPKMPIKKLQVPVNVKKKQPKPKLRKRIVVKPNISKSMPDIKMPEVSGLKGGLGAGAGLGSGAGLGFSMPEIEVFGVRSKGEKVFIALDATQFMLRDSLGGISAYRIIKDELSKIISRLSPTTLFNVAVFGNREAAMLFPKMVPANAVNLARVSKWLDPLNEVVSGRDAKAYGVGTLGSGGTPIQGDYLRGDFSDMYTAPSWGLHWYTPVGAAMEQQADAVFVLTSTWSTLRRSEGAVPEWPLSKQVKYEEKVREGWALVAAENERRAANGEPPQVISNDHVLLITYWSQELLEELRQPEPEFYYYEARDAAKSIYLCRQDYAPKTSKTGLKKKRKGDFSLNVIYFEEKGHPGDEWQERFKTLTDAFGGQFRHIGGLEAIKKSVSAE